MAEKDLGEKYLEEYPDVFADIVNVLLLGEDYVAPEDLYNGPTESIYKAENGADIKEQRRDISKYFIRDNKIMVLFGIENQSAVDKYMPVRVMGYDYSSYRSQLIKGERRYPVITLILNFTDRRWNRPLSLKDILVYPEQFREYISDYHIRVIDVAYIPKEKRELLKSDFKAIADFFTQKRENGRYIPDYKELSHSMAVLNMLKIFTGDKRYEVIESEIREKKRKGEVITMCTFADEMENRGIQKGILLGREEGREEGRIMEAVSIYTEELHLSKKEILDKIMIRFGLKKEDAKNYLSIC